VPRIPPPKPAPPLLLGREATDAIAPKAKRTGPDRKKRLSSEIRKAALIEAAFAEFVASGYANARIEDIARRAGVAKGLVLFYFRRKPALFKAVIEQFLPPILVDLEHLFAPDDPCASDILRSGAEIIYRQTVKNERHRNLIRLLVAESAQFPELAEIYYSEIVTRAVSWGTRVYRLGLETGEFRDAPLGRAPHVLLSPWLYASMWTMLFGSKHPLDLELFLEAHLDTMLNGLRNPKVRRRANRRSR
jgi:AcrR family transcriptional regulator